MKIAKKIINEILDEGLANSTFRDKYPEAYNELIKYRADMEISVCKELRNSENLIADLQTAYYAGNRQDDYKS